MGYFSQIVDRVGFNGGTVSPQPSQLGKVAGNVAVFDDPFDAVVDSGSNNGLSSQTVPFADFPKQESAPQAFNQVTKLAQIKDAFDVPRKSGPKEHSISSLDHSEVALRISHETPRPSIVKQAALSSIAGIDLPMEDSKEKRTIQATQKMGIENVVETNIDSAKTRKGIPVRYFEKSESIQSEQGEREASHRMIPPPPFEKAMKEGPVAMLPSVPATTDWAKPARKETTSKGLVIGKLKVEVLPPPSPSVKTAKGRTSQPRAAPVQKATNGFTSKLRFGFGQI